MQLTDGNVRGHLHNIFSFRDWLCHTLTLGVQKSLLSVFLAGVATSWTQTEKDLKNKEEISSSTHTLPGISILNLIS